MNGLLICDPPQTSKRAVKIDFHLFLPFISLNTACFMFLPVVLLLTFYRFYTARIYCIHSRMTYNTHVRTIIIVIFQNIFLIKILIRMFYKTRDLFKRFRYFFFFAWFYLIFHRLEFHYVHRFAYHLFLF